jgi:hypothetical protein
MLQGKARKVSRPQPLTFPHLAKNRRDWGTRIPCPARPNSINDAPAGFPSETVRCAASRGPSVALVFLQVEHVTVGCLP